MVSSDEEFVALCVTFEEEDIEKEKNKNSKLVHEINLEQDTTFRKATSTEEQLELILK